MNKRTLLIIIGIFILAVLSVTFFYFFKNKDAEPEESLTEKNLILDYYPKQGPVNSYVSLKIDASSINPEDLRALFNEKEIPIELGSEDIVRIIIPADAQSGEIKLKTDDFISNPASFSVEEMEIKELMSETVSPSSQNQTISYNDEIIVNLPSGILDQDRKLTISETNNAPCSFSGEKTQGFSFDVSLEGLEQLNGYVEIGVKYDSELLDPDYPQEDQFIAMRWDEKEKMWIDLPIRVDSGSETLYMLTDHLTGFEWLAIAGATLASKPITLLGEKLLNDVYITPQGNFKILYSEEGIREDDALDDNWWVRKTYPDANQINYQDDYPKSIQDVGSLFEAALASYLDLGFENPVKLKQEWFGDGEYKKQLIVKIDSWWLAVSGEPNYEKIWQRIHIPSIRLKDKDLMKKTIGHELFHRMQAEYYSRAGFLFPSNGWWLEATAEYAGHNVAWPESIPGLNEQIGADFLSHSIATKGLIQGNGWGEKRFEYASAVWIRYLVESKGLNFKEMVEYVSGGNPLERLDAFIKSKGSDLMSYYKDFVYWALFSNSSFLANYSAEEKAENYSSVDLSSKTPSLKIKVESGADQNAFVNIFKINQNKTTNEIPYCFATLSGSDDYVVEPKKGELIYLLAINGSDQKKEINLSATPINEGTGEKGEEIEYTFNLDDNYSSKLWIIKVEGEGMTLEGTYEVGIEGVGYNQELYDFGTYRYKFEIEGGATVDIEPDCDQWYYPELGEEGCTKKMNGSSWGSVKGYVQGSYLKDGVKYWKEWEECFEQDLSGYIEENSYYETKVNRFYFLIMDEETKINSVNPFTGSFDQESNEFSAESRVHSILSNVGGNDIKVRWSAIPPE